MEGGCFQTQAYVVAKIYGCAPMGFISMSAYVSDVVTGAHLNIRNVKNKAHRGM